MAFIVEKTYFFFLPKSASQMDRGFKNALANKSSWEEYNFPVDDINTYDRATTMVVKDDKVYEVFKDYVNVTDAYRVYICVESDLETEN